MKPNNKPMLPQRKSKIHFPFSEMVLPRASPSKRARSTEDQEETKEARDSQRNHSDREGDEFPRMGGPLLRAEPALIEAASKMHSQSEIETDIFSQPSFLNYTDAARLRQRQN